MIWTALEKYRDLGLLILRLGFGLGFAYFHGWGKLVGGPERWRGLGANMRYLGLDVAPVFWGFMAAFAETVGGVLFALGLFFRPAAFLLAFTMLVAVVSTVAGGQGWDESKHAFKNLFVALGLLFVGPGRYSLDERFRHRGRRR